MNDTRHSEMVTALVKPPQLIAEQLTDTKIDLIHAVMGIVGEAGELLDAVKKFVIYDKPLDLQNVIEEMGDLEFYMEQLRQRLVIPREVTLQANMEKLAKRYNGMKYSDQAAHKRADKVERKHFPGEPSELTEEEVLKMVKHSGHAPEGWAMEEDGDDVRVWKL